MLNPKSEILIPKFSLRSHFGEVGQIRITNVPNPKPAAICNLRHWDLFRNWKLKIVNCQAGGLG